MKKDLEKIIGCKLAQIRLATFGAWFERQSDTCLFIIKTLTGWHYDIETNIVSCTKNNFHCQFAFNSLNLYEICKRFAKLTIAESTPPAIELKPKIEPARLSICPDFFRNKGKWAAPKRRVKKAA